MENIYFTTSDYNNFTSNILDIKKTQKNLVNKCDLNENISKKGRNKTLATKADINNKTSNMWYSFFIGQSYFNDMKHNFT